MQISQECISVADGSFEYDVKTFTGIGAQNQPSIKPHIIIANGWIANARTSGRIARGLVDAAQGNIRVTVYDDPLVGTSAYGQSYKTERLVRTAQAIDTPLTLLGHSRGWLSAVDASADLVECGHVRALAGLTPMGHNEMRQLRIGQTATRVGKEIIASVSTISDAGSIAIIGAVGYRGLVHVSDRLRQAMRELEEVLCRDVTPLTVDLSSKVPTTIITGARDFMVPTDQLQAHLSSNGYRGMFAVTPTTHVGAVSDMRAMAATYAGLQRVL
jgi:pimeloyl-ACP methyl ester carboxylesterase